MSIRSEILLVLSLWLRCIIWMIFSCSTGRSIEQAPVEKDLLIRKLWRLRENVFWWGTLLFRKLRWYSRVAASEFTLQKPCTKTMSAYTWFENWNGISKFCKNKHTTNTCLQVSCENFYELHYKLIDKLLFPTLNSILRMNRTLLPTVGFVIKTV